MNWSTTKTTLVALCLSACSGGSLSPTPPAVPPTVNPTPNLSPGPHLGYIVGFDALDAQQRAIAENRFSAAVAAGMRIARVQFGWGELESAPGVFERGALMSVLDQASVSGQQVFFTLSTLDTGELTIPTDLMSTDRLSPAPGLTLDGAEISTRFRAFLDWLIPEIAAYDVWGLAIANEPSTLFESISQQEISNFLISGADYANAFTDEIAITVTIAGAADSNAEIIQFVADLMPHLNIASYNYYCLGTNTLQTTDLATWTADVNTLIARAQGREIFFQELGCPAGWSDLGGLAVPPPPMINATPQIQADFFRFMLAEIETRDELRAATVFQLNDWSPELAKLISDPFRLGGDPVTADRFEEWLATVGMCRWSDGSCRDAYAIFLDGVARTAGVRKANSGRSGFVHSSVRESYRQRSDDFRPRHEASDWSAESLAKSTEESHAVASCHRTF